MRRHFNTAGPCQPDIHYLLPSLQRLPQVEQLIAQRSYFVIHAPRQVGKTTAMLALAQQLTASGQYTAILMSVETGARQPDLDRAEQSILTSWQGAIRAWLPPDLHPDWSSLPTSNRLSAALQSWAETSPRPLVVFIDEIDSLQDDTLIAILRQLREGASRRPNHFPHSLALIGLRDVRDYKVASGGSGRLNTASPFNIKAESLTMRDFTSEEVAQLYQQHTDETGQRFAEDAIALVFELTQGQPWLVNALARQLVEVLLPDPALEVTPELVLEAKEILIRRQDTHLDSLDEKLLEDRVKAIMEPMLAGLALGNVPKDDRQYVIDLGLVKRDPEGGLVIANPIYREVMPRALAQSSQDSLPKIAPSWLTEIGELNVDYLRDAFLEFWLQHGEPLLGSAPYHEIAPHLVLMAFLHRVVNGGGTLDREYAIGRDRMDLCLRYGAVTLGIELKVWRDRKSDPLNQGKTQLDSYLARLGQDTGWLVIFDRRSNAEEIESRLNWHIETSDSGRLITVIRA